MAWQAIDGGNGHDQSCYLVIDLVRICSVEFNIYYLKTMAECPTYHILQLSIYLIVLVMVMLMLMF